MNCRIASPNDIDLLTEMNIRLRADERIDNLMSDNEVRQRMVEMLEETYTALIFSAEDGTVIGYTLTDHARNPMYLRQLFAKREFRRMGFGHEMMVTTMRHLNTTEIDLEVMIWNEGARAFYQRIGCRERYVGLRYRLEQ